MLEALAEAPGGGEAMYSSSGGGGGGGGFVPPQCNGFDGRRARQNLNFERPTIDYNSIVIRSIESRIFQTDEQDYLSLQPNDEYMSDMCTAGSRSMLMTPSNSYCNYHMHTAYNRDKYPIYCAKWTMEGRRVISGAQSGEFTLWNGLHFNFETIVQAHENGNRAMEWSHDEQNMVASQAPGRRLLPPQPFQSQHADATPCRVVRRSRGTTMARSSAGTTRCRWLGS